jgi:hypothetical protein
MVVMGSPSRTPAVTVIVKVMVTKTADPVHLDRISPESRSGRSHSISLTIENM